MMSHKFGLGIRDIGGRRRENEGWKRWDKEQGCEWEIWNWKQRRKMGMDRTNHKMAKEGMA